MEWSYLELGSVEVVAADPRGVLVEYKASYGPLGLPQNLVRIVVTGETFVAEDTDKPARRGFRQPPPPPPFERTALGKKSRLAWPQGATAIGQYDHLTGWDERYAIVFEEGGFSIIDAESDRFARLTLGSDDLRWGFAEPIASVGHVWMEVDNGLIAIPTAPLEALAAGSVDIKVTRHYPRRRRDAKLECVFCWYLQSGQAMVEIGDGKGGPAEPKLTIDLPRLPLAKYTPVVLVDELYPGRYDALQIVGGQRIALANRSSPTKHTAKITLKRAKDPTGVAKAPKSSQPARRSSAELERLVAAVAANPTDDTQRAVLVDLLLELGDPSAEAIAKLRADGKASPATVKKALGPLGLYLTKVELAGGFPVDAMLARDAPDAEDHPAELEAACDDFRLSLIHTLRSQGSRSSSAIYARLVGSPKATSLRRVDVSDADTIDALIAAKRDHLQHLDNVDFAGARSMERLATPTFDRVKTVHALVGLAHLQPLVNRLIKDKSTFFKCARRRLVLDETRDRHAELFRALAAPWPKLPIDALTIAGVTVERSGKISGDDTKLVAVAKKAFTADPAKR